MPCVHASHPSVAGGPCPILPGYVLHEGKGAPPGATSLGAVPSGGGPRDVKGACGQHPACTAFTAGGQVLGGPIEPGALVDQPQPAAGGGCVGIYVRGTPVDPASLPADTAFDRESAADCCGDCGGECNRGRTQRGGTSSCFSLG